MIFKGGDKICEIRWFFCIGATEHQKVHFVFHQFSTQLLAAWTELTTDLQVMVLACDICLSQSPTNCN